MKLETIKHSNRIVSMVSESMADHFKDRVTPAQYEVLKHNVYTIEFDKDSGWDKKYRGCGCGWAEIDKNGNFIDMKYLDEDVVDYGAEYYEEDGVFEEVDIVVVSSPEKQKEYLMSGQEEQNVDMLDFHTDQLAPLILANGNIRILVNFSSTQLVRF